MPGQLPQQRPGPAATARSRVPSQTALEALRVDDLISFLVLAQELHFSKAALRIGVTTGALSRRISNLEGLLKLELIDRTVRPVELTARGADFAVLAERLVRSVQAVLEPGGAAVGSSSLPEG